MVNPLTYIAAPAFKEIILFAVPFLPEKASVISASEVSALSALISFRFPNVRPKSSG